MAQKQINADYKPVDPLLDGEMLATFLTKPDTKKETLLEESERFVVGHSSMQGWRRTMEDVAVSWLKIPGDTTGTSYFAIFDGHGGSSVSEYAGTFLLHNIMNQKEWTTDLKEAIRKGFVECDQQLRDEKDPKTMASGSTACTLFIRGNEIYCGNVGDSRAIGSEADRIVRLSHDHKPSVPGERERILSAGGHVYMDRVNGSLGLSRALGDFSFKKQRTPPDQQMVSAVPEIVQKTVDKRWNFVIVACDGIWEVLNDDSVHSFVKTKLFQKVGPAQAAESLIQHCLAPTCDLYAVGCDNMTATIVQFKWDHPSSKKESKKDSKGSAKE